LTPACDRMFGQFLKLGRPVRVDRPMGLKVTAEPAQELRSSAVLGDFDCIVDANKSGTPFGLFVDTSKVWQGWVSATPVGVDDDRIGRIQGRVIGGPAVSHHLDLDAGY